MDKIVEEFRCVLLITSKRNILFSKNILFQGFKTNFGFLHCKGFSVIPELIKVREYG